MKINNQVYSGLTLGLFNNSQGSPCFSLKGTENFKINGIKNANDFFRMLHGSLMMLDETSEGRLSIVFFSRGPKQWWLVLEKIKSNFTLKVMQVANSLLPEVIKQELRFCWQGKAASYFEAIEALIVQSPFSDVVRMDKGVFGFNR